MPNSEQTFFNLVTNAPLGVYVIDSDFRIAHVSQGAQAAFQNVHPLIGHDFDSALRIVWPEPFVSDALNHFRHTLESGESYIAPSLTQERHDLGTVESYEWEIHRIVMPNGKFGVVCYFYESTQIREAERAGRESEERQSFLLKFSDTLRPISDSTEILAEACRLVGQYLKVDRCYYVEVDESREEALVRQEYNAGHTPSLVGMHSTTDFGWILNHLRRAEIVVVDDVHASEFIPEDGRPAMDAIAIASSITVPLMKLGSLLGAFCVTESNPRKWTASEVNIVADTAERIWASVERAKTEEALRASEASVRMIADNISQLAWTCDTFGNVTWYNQRWLDYTGMTFEEMKGWNWSKVQHPDHLARVVATVEFAAKTGQPWEDTFPLRGRDGEYRWFLSRAVPIRDDQGQIFQWFGTNTDITEQLMLEKALRDADRRKDEFLATLAHELRNPLAPVRSAVDLLGRTTLDANAQWSHDVIKRQVDHLVRLVDDLLDISRITRDKFELKVQQFELAELIQTAIEACRPGLEQADHKLTVNLPSEPIVMSGDIVRLSQVLINLLNNACRYTDPGGEIQLNANEDGDWIDLRIKDNGSGIESDQLPMLFDMFYRSENSSTQSPSGLGIGLSLVKRLVEMHGGTVEALSDGLGTGSEFVVRLPAAPKT